MKRFENKLIINAWELEEYDFFNYFNNKITSINNINIYEAIQKYALNEIKNIINQDEAISDLIFTGKGVYAQPYFATFMFFNNKLDIFKKLIFMLLKEVRELKFIL